MDPCPCHEHVGVIEPALSDDVSSKITNGKKIGARTSVYSNVFHHPRFSSLSHSVPSSVSSVHSLYRTRPEPLHLSTPSPPTIAAVPRYDLRVRVRIAISGPVA